ncbi:MAG: hypothetical protein RXR52_35710 [Paraburkholderia sp.]|uniref:hypothetical protein n=1 Tax=Paraburkholderia sp. TaxID=1926495 RepID=UPI00397C9CE6
MERTLLVCVGVVLVVAAHLLPALCRPHGWRIRTLGAALWIGCMAVTCYGHAMFFVMAQQHAGEIRAAAVPVVSAPGRNMAEIARDRAGVVARLARVSELKCGDRCSAVRIEHTILTARLAALDAESTEVTRHELAQNHANAERATAKADPVAGSLSAFGVSAGRVDLFAGMAFAVVIEGVACFCWLLALRPVKVPTKTVAPVMDTSRVPPVKAVTPTSQVVATGGNDATDRQETVKSRASEQTDELSLVLTAIRDGTVRGTVAEIRKHLGCSQARALALRKQLAQRMQSRPPTTEQLL